MGSVDRRQETMTR